MFSNILQSTIQIVQFLTEILFISLTRGVGFQPLVTNYTQTALKR